MNLKKFLIGGNVIKKQWELLSMVPGGKALFSKFVGKMAPYTGTIRAQVIELKAGYAKLKMRDRKILRNHLNSIHAIALMVKLPRVWLLVMECLMTQEVFLLAFPLIITKKPGAC